MSNPSAKLRTRKILVVDDDEGILDALQVMLEDEGYTVETSLNGEILEKLKKSNLPDLILLDILLSGKDGRELCKILKRQSTTKKVPVIMITAHPVAKNQIKMYGAEDFLPKPFAMKDVLAKIEKYTS
jgi:DNA-binding response OmpR family regulator